MGQTAAGPTTKMDGLYSTAVAFCASCPVSGRKAAGLQEVLVASAACEFTLRLAQPAQDPSFPDAGLTQSFAILPDRRRICAPSTSTDDPTPTMNDHTIQGITVVAGNCAAPVSRNMEATTM